MSVFFAGRLLITPAVASQVYDRDLIGVFPGQAGNVVALIGPSDGGKPKTALEFSSPTQARRVLAGGELLTAVEKAFAPSAETGSPARVVAMRVNPATQATLALLDAGAATVIDLTSVDYGVLANGINVQIAAGTSSGKRVTVTQGTEYYTKDNLERIQLTVRYSGTEVTATVAVDSTTMTLEAPALTPVATLTLASYVNTQQLVDAINAVPDFSASTVLPTSPIATALDGLAATSAKDVDLAIKADLQAIIDWFNTGGSTLVSAVRASGAVNVPADISVNLSGGSLGSAPITQDWQDAFDALQGEDVQWIVPLTENQAIWSMANAHVLFMSSAGQSERRAFVGGLSTDTKQNAIDGARAINSDRTALVWPAPLDFDDSGQLIARPAYIMAAQIAGGFAAVNPGTTLTNKALPIAGLQPLLSNVVDTDDLIVGGVLSVRRTKRGFVVTRAISTWLSDSRYNRVEISTGAAVDYTVRLVREALSIFIGRKASPITLHEAISVTESALSRLAIPEPAGIGVLVGDEKSPAFRDITASIEGDILSVQFLASPVIPINYVLVGVYLKAYSGVATQITH